MLKNNKKTNQIVTMRKEEYEHHKKIQRKKKIQQLKRYLNLLHFKNLNKRIETYGFDYSFSKYISTILIMMGCIVLSGYLFQLKTVPIMFLGCFAILLLPIIVLSQIMYLNQNKRFEQIVTYLQEMIICFQTQPKVYSSLKEVNEYFEDGIKKEIEDAILYIETEAEDDNLYENALAIIEKKYPCSRLKSLHNLMTTVENQNSINYQSALKDLDLDIHSWTSRVYDYQLDIKNIKKQFSILILLTIGVTAAMVNILPASMVQFVSSHIYQTATVLMLASFLVMFCFAQSKLNGQWLVNDIEKDNKKILKDIDYIENYDEKKQKNMLYIILGLLSIFPLCGLIFHHSGLVVFGILSMIICYLWDSARYRAHYNNVVDEIKKTFPIWLRDVSLNMHNYVVTRAIKQSYQKAPTALQYYLKIFIDAIEKDPISIQPYNQFLKKFQINDISSSMKSLYSIKQQNGENSTQQISNLIVRNQALMETSECIRNQNQLAVMKMIGAFPIIVGSAKLIIDMVLLIAYFMNGIQIGL